jgi:outer membrane protein assembly factor BamA
VRTRWIVGWLCLMTISVSAAEPDSTSTRKRTIVPLPFYFYSPETKSGGGVSVSAFTRDRSREENRPNSYSLLTLYTQRRQFVVGLGAEIYGAQERHRFAVELMFSDFPNTFYGTGPRVDDEGEEYGSRSIGAELSASRKFDSQWRVGPSLSFVEEKLSDFEEDGLLQAGVRGSEGGYVLLVGVHAERDLRDNVFYARSGSFLRVKCDGAWSWLGSEYNFATTEFDLRHYRSRGPLVLALRGTMAAAFDEPPFQALPGVGGDSILRGYYEDRFRDRRAYSLQAELRLCDWHRMGVIGFLDSGDVAPGIDHFSLGTLKASCGLGLRLLLSRSERLQIRADVGFGDDGSNGFYLNIGEAF